jgi:hypothetical protein
MKFDQIYPIFNTWAERHGLQVFTICKDEEVRIVRMYGKGKAFADIGVDVAPGRRYVVSVGIARRPSRKSQFEKLETDASDLDSMLEHAYSMALGWLSGSSRHRPLAFGGPDWRD